MMDDTKTPAELEELLRSSVSFALQKHRYAKPKTHDRTASDAYYRDVAAVVVEHIKLSGWTLEPPQTVRKKPPVAHHSTPPVRSRKEG